MIKKFNTRLKNIAQSIKQIDIVERTTLEVEKELPQDIDEMGQYGLDIYYESQRIKGKIETAVSHRMEVAEALPVALDRLNDLLTLTDEKNLAFLQATSKENLTMLIGFIVQFGEVFQEVLEKLSSDRFAKFYDIVDRARHNRV